MRTPRLTAALLIILLVMGLGGSAAAQTPPETPQATGVAASGANLVREQLAPHDAKPIAKASTQNTEVSPAPPDTHSKLTAPLSIATTGANALREALVPLIILGALVAVLGVDIKPGRFPPYSQPTSPLEQVPLPENLPEPVARFYQAVSGDTVPRIHSAVIDGTAPTRLNGFTLHSRFRFTHQAGRSYHHYIESTAFRRTVFRVNEWYLNGRVRLESSKDNALDGAGADRAANLGLWGESLWLSPIYVTDPRVRWQAIDEHSARLIVPFGAAKDSFTVYFDARTGLIERMETLRSKTISPDKMVRWILIPGKWQRFHGLLIPTSIAVMWEDEGTPWAIFRINDVTYNADVAESIHARGL